MRYCQMCLPGATMAGWTAELAVKADRLPARPLPYVKPLPVNTVDILSVLSFFIL